MAQPQDPSQDPDSPAESQPDSERATPSPPSPAEDDKPAEAKPAGEKKDPEVIRLEKRKFHLDRALKASGRTADGKFAKREEPEAKDDDAEEPDEKDEKDEPDEKEPAAKLDKKTKETVDAKVAKLKNGEHIRKAKDKLREEITALERDKAEHAKRVAEDARINDAADAKYGHVAAAAVAYARKDYRSVAPALEKLFGDPLSKVMRNVYEATKDGASTADLRHEIGELKSEIKALREGTTADKTKAETEAKDKRERAAFDKRVASHGLTEIGDSELSAEAYKLYRDSWDADLEEYSLTPKQAADRVLSREQKRAERITGKRIVARETPRERSRDNVREFRPAEDSKQVSQMSKEEKRKYYLDRALRQTEASRRERQRHA